MSEGNANPALRRKIAAGIATAAALWFCYAGAKHALASHYAASSNFEDWERATRIEPGNPEIWYQLGRFRQLDFDHSNLPLAISDYQRAVQLNSHSPYYKLDLASAFEMSGDNGDADRYFQAAQSGYPISAEVSWKYGNFLLRQQRLPEAYAEIHRALLVDPKLLPLAISRVWHSDPDVHQLLDKALPDTPDADWQAITYLSDAEQASAALAVWDRLVARKPAMEWTEVFALIDLLLAQNRFGESETVWRQAIARDEAATPGYEGDSLVYDGGFEKDISGGGFGWRERDVHGADFSLDTEEKHSGNRSARLAFDGTENLSYEDLDQLVLVSPHTRYRFRGFLRTDQISTNSGIRFEIVDAKNDRDLHVLTPNETGTESWTLEELDFTTGPRTQMIQIRVIRRPSERLDNKIRGTVWIDDVGVFPIADRRK
jgi:tetratricopeptide (TPR) repeat protein